MLFNSFAFVVFLLIVLAVYYPLPHKQQNWFLLAASLFFYACWDWRLIAPLLFTTSLDYWCSRKMAGQAQRKRKPWLLLSVIANLGLLGFFKYYNFFAGSLVGPLHLLVPIGISFYTFQALSYTIDVYRGELHAAVHYMDFLLAVLYFPHLVAGPVQRAASLLPQVTNPRRPTRAGIAAGIHLIVWGYFKKMYIADNLAPVVNQVFAQSNPDGLHVLIASYAFAFQIYCDFSGYTDIARGIAKAMGFEFMLNFDRPYLAADPHEFWRRWHISLSTWLRDYLYIPLGGSRADHLRMHRNILITMVLGGLWHGAAWTFLLWGLYHGVLVVVYRMFRAKVEAVPRWLRVAVFFHLTCYGWLIFRAGSLRQLLQMTRALFAPLGKIDPAPAILLFTIATMASAMWLLYRSVRRMEARTFCYALLLYLVLFRGGAPQSFLYFQF